MSTKQHRNVHATRADAEALESLRHMTSWARQSVVSDEAKPAASRLNYLIDCFALGATAFHPGPWMYPVDLGRDSRMIEMLESDRPQAPSLVARCMKGISNGLVKCFDYIHERRSIARSTVLLSQMDDRALQDIGITRADIGSAVRHGRDWERWH